MNKKIFKIKTLEELQKIKKKRDISFQSTSSSQTVNRSKKVDLRMIREAERLSIEQMQAN